MSTWRLYHAGEPAGIGYDLVVLNAARLTQAPWAVIADPDVLEARALQLGRSIRYTVVDLQQPPIPLEADTLALVPVHYPAEVQAGVLNTDNAATVLMGLECAIDACLQGWAQALVTGPVQKSVLNDAGIAFTGHTEFLAEKTNTEQVVMLLATEQLRVALATTHIPLSQVAVSISQTRLEGILRIIDRDLRYRFGIASPRILVCGLNPHAGEAGHLGLEDEQIIRPAVAALNKQGLQCVGPLPADTLFTPPYLQHADAVLAMYHDQGLPVLKYHGFGRAANITLGLPFIRTSVDHGTALNLAGTGQISLGSLNTAMDYALQLQETV